MEDTWANRILGHERCRYEQVHQVDALRDDRAWNPVLDDVEREGRPSNNKTVDLGRGEEVFGVQQEDECTSPSVTESGTEGGHAGHRLCYERYA